MIHLACVVDDVEGAHRACPPEEGVVIALGPRLACLARTCREEAPTAALTDLVTHDRLLRRVMHSGTSLVPFRYGTVLADPVQVEAELAPRRQELTALLDRMRGRVELAVRAGLSPAGHDSLRDSARADQPGTAYLRSLVPLGAQSPLKRLHRILADSAVAAVAEPDGGDGMKASYLVDAGRADAFAEVLDRAVAATGGLGPVSLTGPWAPYTFATMSGAAGPVAPGRLSGAGHG